MNIRMRYLLGFGVAMIVGGIIVRHMLLHDTFHPLVAFHRLVVNRPQRHPPNGIWLNTCVEQMPKPFRIPEAEMFFAEFGGTESLFMCLRTNAAYQTILRAHFGSMLWDGGSWQITETGDIVLRSTQKFHILRSDDHWYILVCSNTLADLPTIRTNVRDLLVAPGGSTSLLCGHFKLPS